MNSETPRPRPTTITITREQIKKTKAFQNATAMMQNLALGRTNYRCIEHGVNVATNIGFEKWDAQTNASFLNREIIQELIKNNE